VLYAFVGDIPASEFYMQTFRNTLSVPSSYAGRYLSMKMEQTACSETLTYTIQTPVNHPDESIQLLILVSMSLTSYSRRTNLCLTQPANTLEHNELRTRGLLNDSSPCGPKYNWKHREHILSQPCIIQINRSCSEPKIHICTTNRRF
jgi:hypothetical protein